MKHGNPPGSFVPTEFRKKKEGNRERTKRGVANGGAPPGEALQVKKKG